MSLPTSESSSEKGHLSGDIVLEQNVCITEFTKAVKVHILSCIAAYVLAQPKVKMGNIVVPDVIRSIANAT